MIGLNTNVSMYFYTEPCDMRKSFDGLCGIVINSMKMNMVLNLQNPLCAI